MDKESQFQAVLQANSDRIYRVCCCYVRDENARQDVFQTVLLHLWESLETFQGGSQISTWIFRVAVNTCLGHLRTERREQRLLAEVAGQAQHAGVLLSPSPAFLARNMLSASMDAFTNQYSRKEMLRRTRPKKA